MRWTYLNGAILFAAGLLCLVGAAGFLGLRFLLPPLARGEEELFVTVILVLLIAGGNLLAVGTYRMLCHLYRAVSCSDPASDRAMAGRPVYLLGYLGSVMGLTVLLFFVLLMSLSNVRRDQVVWVFLPVCFAGMFCVLVACAGLLLMLNDIFLRHQEVERRRDRLASAVKGATPDERSRPTLGWSHYEGIEPAEQTRRRRADPDGGGP